MKKNVFILQGLLSLSLVGGLVSCNSQLDDAVGKSEIKLTSKLTNATEVITRVNALDYQSTQIIEGQQVGITIIGAQSEHNNVAWTVASDGTLNNNALPVYWDNTPATITAYHPYKSDWTGTSHTFYVSTDQSTEAGYRNSDLLWATKTANKADGMVTLNFTHKLAKINITLSSDDITDLSGAVISICGANTSANFNPTTGELNDASSFSEIKAGVTTPNAYTASAIIVPQTITAGKRFIKVFLGDRDYYYKLDADKEFLSGYCYNYKIKLKETDVALEFESSNISDWGNTTDMEIDAEANIPEILPIWFDTNQYITYVKNPEFYYTGRDDDYSHSHSSAITFPTFRISKMELKYQMEGNTTLDRSCYLFCNNTAKNNYDALVINNDGMIFTDGANKCTYSWSELNANPLDCMTLSISFDEKYIRVNGKDAEYKFTEDINFTPSYLFSCYDDDKEYESCLIGNGVPEGSKLYYAKVWDENGNLVYLGGATRMFRSTTNEEEYCWCHCYEGSIVYHFANYLEESYKPYGGGKD